MISYNKNGRDLNTGRMDLISTLLQLGHHATSTLRLNTLKEKYKGQYDVKFTVDKIGGLECAKCHY